MALTATATPQVRTDIVQQLKLKSPSHFIGLFDRPNLRYVVLPKIVDEYDDYPKLAFSQIDELITEYRGEPAIIYCRTRKQTEEIAKYLWEQGFNAACYLAGMSNQDRRIIQEEFINGTCQIVVATIAFGMGIDKPDIRLIIHHDLPKSVEAYYQQTGRAGRDGHRSECILLYSPHEMSRQEYFIDQIEDESVQEMAFRKLDSMVEFCELDTCRREFLSEYLGDDDFANISENLHCCDVCTELEVWEDAREEKPVVYPWEGVREEEPVVYPVATDEERAIDEDAPWVECQASLVPLFERWEEAREEGPAVNLTIEEIADSNLQVNDATDEDAELTNTEDYSATTERETTSETLDFGALSSDEVDEGGPSLTTATSAKTELEVWEDAREEGPAVNPVATGEESSTDDNVRMYLREIGDVQLLSKADEAMLSKRVESANWLEKIEWGIRGTLGPVYGFKEYPRNRDQLPDNPPPVPAIEVVAIVLRRLGRLDDVADHIALYLGQPKPVTLEHLLTNPLYRDMINEARRHSGQRRPQTAALRAVAEVPLRHPGDR